MTKKFLLCLISALLCLSAGAQEYMTKAYNKNIDTSKFYKVNQVSTRYNWTEIVVPIIKGARTDMQKAYAIYNYICENISYDTNYRIYHVDECWQNKRGVCQAYSELYYCMAKAAGLECDIITGTLVNHAWNGVKINGKWILLDSTWGAGTVNNSHYEKRLDHDVWYNVDPYWMIFTHYPDNPNWQMIEKKLSSSDFSKLPKIASMDKYGLNAKKVFNGFITGKLKQMPDYYNCDGLTRFKVLNIPMNKRLKKGALYTFKFKPESGEDWAIINESDWLKSWIKDTKGNYIMQVVPKNTGKLSLSVKLKNKGESYWTAIDYQVE